MPATSDTHEFRKEHCLPRLSGATKEEVITELIQCFVTSEDLDDQEAIDLGVEIIAREEEATTGIGKGVALPHARDSEVVDGVRIAVGVHPDGIEFDSLDGEPVYVVFLIAASDPHDYLRVAGRIARIARDNVEMKALRLQTTPTRMAKFLAESWDSVGV